MKRSSREMGEQVHVEESTKPMNLEVYNNLVQDFNKLTSYSRKAENELKNKYQHLSACTFGSLFSLLVQRVMKQRYRKSPSISNKYHELYQNLLNEHTGNKITHLADSQGISPALFARSLLQHVYGDSTMVKRCLKDTNLIDDPDLAYEVFLGVMNDNHYGPYSDVIKQCIGQEYETKLQHDLQSLNITFSDENELRLRGYDKTPDFKLDVPIAVGDFIVHWIESKALFGDEENHSIYLTEQFTSYYNRFGTGMVIYWFGYLETLERTPEVNNMFILNTSLPPKEQITMFDFNAIYPYSQYIKQSSSAYGVFENP